MNLLWICGTLLVLLMAVACALLDEPLRGGGLVAPLLAFIPYSVAAWRAQKLDWRRARLTIWLVALLTRGLMLTSPFTLSNDVHRYHWEGTVQNAGWSVYRYPPAAVELTGLRNRHWEDMDHREVPSAYPPLLLAVFQFGARLSDQATLFKWVFGLFDLATLAVLVGWLRARGQNRSLALIWAWSPLVIVEFSGMAHGMSLAIACGVAGLWALHRQRFTMAGAALAAAPLAHLLALPIIIAVILAQRIWQPRFWWGFITTGLLFCLPHAGAGRDLALGLTHFGARWEFNGSLFPLVTTFTGHAAPRQLADHLWLADLPAKVIVTAILAGVMWWTIRRRYPSSRAALAVAAAVLLLSPTVHPWYVTWLVALCCVEFRPAWLLLSGTVLASYVAKVIQLETGQWTELAAIRWLEYVPVYGLWLASLTGWPAPGTMPSRGNDASSSFFTTNTDKRS